MEHAQQQQFQQLKQLSQEMLHLANESHWDDVAAKELQRQEVMHKAFSVPVAASDASVVKSLVTEVLSISDEITHLAYQAKSAVGDELQQMNKGKQAASAYLQNTR